MPMGSNSAIVAIVAIVWVPLVVGCPRSNNSNRLAATATTTRRRPLLSFLSLSVLLLSCFALLCDGYLILRPFFSTAPLSSPTTTRMPQRGWFADDSSSSSYTRRITVLWMGKGDGKRKRPKQQPSQQPNDGASTTSSGSPPLLPQQQQQPNPPRRVSTNLNIPVRTQIAMAQANKAFDASRQKAAGGSSSFQPPAKAVVRTSYRRAWDPQELELKAEERRQRGSAKEDWDVILNRTVAAPLMIVDGYNIIHKWPRLKKHMVRGDPGHARRLLLEDLENLRCVKGWRIECVFDGTKRNINNMGPLGHGASSVTKSMEQSAKQSVSKFGVRVVFSGIGMEADTYIEGRCTRAKNVTHGAMTGSLIVATDDAMIRIAGQNAGAVCMSADRFVDELKALKKAIDYQVEVAVARVNGHVVRPEQLRGRNGGAVVQMPQRFGRRSVLLEDKRNRTKQTITKEEEEDAFDIDLSNIHLEEDENGIPWWAKVPDQKQTYK